MLNLIFLKLYFGKHLVYGFEIFPLKTRGLALFGITWDNYDNEIDLYIDVFYRNILEKTIVKG